MPFPSAVIPAADHFKPCRNLSDETVVPLACTAPGSRICCTAAIVTSSNDSRHWEPWIWRADEPVTHTIARLGGTTPCFVPTLYLKRTALLCAGSLPWRSPLTILAGNLIFSSCDVRLRSEYQYDGVCRCIRTHWLVSCGGLRVP